MLAWFRASRLGDVRRVTLALALMLVSALLVGVLAGCVSVGGVLFAARPRVRGWLRLAPGHCNEHVGIPVLRDGGTFTYY